MRAISRRSGGVASARGCDCGRAQTRDARGNVRLSPGWRRLLRLSFGRRSVERDVDEELAFHLAMREEKLRRLGVEAEEAHAQAQERFGDPDKFRDECISIGQHYRR